MHMRKAKSILRWAGALLLAFGLFLAIQPAGLAAQEDGILRVPLDFSRNVSPVLLQRDEWTWDGVTRTLTLSDGLRMQTNGTCITMPDNATIVVEGRVELTAGSGLAKGAGSGIVLGERCRLELSNSSMLKITAAGDGIQASRLSLDRGSLEISAEGNCLNLHSGGLKLGEDTVVSLSGSGVAIQSLNGEVSLDGELHLTALSGGIQSSGNVTFSNTSKTSIQCAGQGAAGIVSKGTVSVDGPLTITAAGDGIQCSGSILLQGDLSVTAGGAGIAGQRRIEGEQCAISISAAKGPAVQAGEDLNLTNCTVSCGETAGDGLSAKESMALSHSEVSIERTNGNALVSGKNIQINTAVLQINQAGAAGIRAGGDLLAEECTAAVENTGGDGLSAKESIVLSHSEVSIERTGGNALVSGKDLQLNTAVLQINQAGAAGIRAGGDLSAEDCTAAVERTGGEGLSAGKSARLENTQFHLGTAEGYGVRTSEQFYLDSGSTLTIERAGEAGISARWVELCGTAALKALGDGIQGLLGVVCRETGLFTIEADGNGVVSRRGAVTLAARPDGQGSITAGVAGVVAEREVSLSQPGTVSIHAGTVGVKAQGDVNVGGHENAVCDLSITCQEESIWSEAGNVSLQRCGSLYFFDGAIHVDSAIGKTLSVLDGAGLLFGMKRGFAIGIIRKDYTITPDQTPELLQLRVLQIGKACTVTVAPGAKVKAGPLILEENARLIADLDSSVYYNGPTTQVEGQVKEYLSSGMNLTAGAQNTGIRGAEWDGSTLTLKGAVVDVTNGPALTLPAGSTIQLEGETSYLTRAGDGPVLQCDGPLTIKGGSLAISGGAVGIQAGGPLKVENTSLSIRGASEAAVSAGAFTSRNTALDCYGDGTAVRVLDGTIEIDSLPDVPLEQKDGYTVLHGDGKPGVFSAPAGGPPPEQIMTQTEVNPDGSVTVITKNTVTGEVNETVTAPDGTITILQTRPDGVVSTIAPRAGQESDREQTDGGNQGQGAGTDQEEGGSSPEEGVSRSDEGQKLLGFFAEVALPEGMEKAVVRLPIPNATPTTVAKRPGEETPIRLSSFLDGALGVCLDGSTQLDFFENEKTFLDVPKESWYAGPVAFVTSRELFFGTGDGAFSPDGTTTCGMAATALYRLAGEPEVEFSEDDPHFENSSSNEFYADGVAWVFEQGLMDGTQDGFSAPAFVTREQLAVMLYRSAGLFGIDTQQRAPLSQFTDSDDASEWAAAGLRWAVACQILRGRGDGTLDPAGTATRAEISAVFQRFVYLLLENQEDYK